MEEGEWDEKKEEKEEIQNEEIMKWEEMQKIAWIGMGHSWKTYPLYHIWQRNASGFIWAWISFPVDFFCQGPSLNERCMQ
jgi:hypothetical protein